jgi:uncharacterized protein (TIGR00251 family)
MKLVVRAVPNAKRSEWIGWEEDPRAGRVARVRIAAPPVDGKANEALRSFLAKHLGVPKSQVILEKGGSSRLKTFTVPEGCLPE